MNSVSRIFGFGLLVVGVLANVQTSEGASRVAPSSSPSPAATAAALVGNATIGKETFTQYCSICHGVHAQGFIGPHIGGIDWTVPGLHEIVRQGVGGYGGMPSFNADVVTDKNIADIAAFLASLGAVAASPAPSSTPVPAAASPMPASTPVAQTASSGAGDALHGRQIFTANCSSCHGANAQGGFGPNLHGEKNRKDLTAAITFIKNPKSPMPKLFPSVLSAKDVEDVAAYVESL